MERRGKWSPGSIFFRWVGDATADISRTVTKSAATPTELLDLSVDEWSLVKRGANRRKFVIAKMDYETMENVNMEETNEETEYEQALFEKTYIEQEFNKQAAEVVRKSGNPSHTSRRTRHCARFRSANVQPLSTHGHAPESSLRRPRYRRMT